MSNEKTKFPDFVTEKLDSFVEHISNEGEFFSDPGEFPDKESVEIGKIHLWNMLGQAILERYLKDPEDVTLTVEEVEKLLINVIIQTNLDLLLNDKLIDGIENEHGEMVYWVTDKGKDIYKSLGPES